MKIRVYGKVVLSEVDGPGQRAVVHFAGCSRRCPGCFNEKLQDGEGPDVRGCHSYPLAQEILAVSRSVSISGGEPTEQIEQLVGLLHELRDDGCDDIVLYTGRTLAELRLLPAWRHIERHRLVDVVVDGPFIKDLEEMGDWMRGSSNQEIVCLTDRWTLEDFRQRAVQIEFDAGDLVVTGFPDDGLRDMLSGLG